MWHLRWKIINLPPKIIEDTVKVILPLHILNIFLFYRDINNIIKIEQKFINNTSAVVIAKRYQYIVTITNKKKVKGCPRAIILMKLHWNNKSYQCAMIIRIMKSWIVKFAEPFCFVFFVIASFCVWIDDNNQNQRLKWLWDNSQ